MLTIPEDQSRLCTLMCTGDDGFPKLAGANGFGVCRFVKGCLNWKAMRIVGIFRNSLHEFITQSHTHICSGNFAEILFHSNELLDVRMGNVHRDHECAAATMLSHFA